MSQPRHEHIWGLHVGDGVLRLVHLARDAGSGPGPRVQAMHETPWPAGTALAEAVGKLTALPRGARVVVALRDDAVLYHELTLPEAPPAALAQMVAAQAEALLPVAADPLAWGWARLTDGEAGAVNVRLCAARRQQLQDIRQALGAERVVAVVPAGLAAAAACARWWQPSEQSAVIHVGEYHSTILHWQHGSARRCQVVSHEPDASSWAQEVARELSTSGQPLPQQCILIGDASDAHREALGALLRTAVTLPESAAEVQSGKAQPSRAAAAALGAALHGLQAQEGIANLLDGDAARQASSRKPLAWRPIAAAAWVLLAVIGLYFADVRDARVAQAQIDAQTASAAKQAELARALEVTRYLRSLPPSPLLVLDELSTRAPDKIIITSFRYSGQGSVQISGTAPSGVAEYDKTLTRLSQSPMLQRVRPTSATVENNQWKFDIEMTLRPLDRYQAMAAAARAAERRAAAQKQSQAEASPSPDAQAAAANARGSRP